MIRSSPLFVIGIKVVSLTAITAILFSASLSMAIQSSYAQFGAQTQEQEPTGAGEQQVESDGGLTATLNGDSFTMGDTVTISGTVQQREPDSYVAIEVIDPQSNTVETAFPDVTADNTFTHSFVAGEQEEFETDEPMEITGNYRIVARYFPPSDEAETEEVELVFEYSATTEDVAAESEEAAGPTTIFQSIEDGIRLQVPNDWVVEDINSTDPQEQQFTEQYGAEYLVVICPENQALPIIGGLYTCTAESPNDTMVESYRFVDLSSRPEFAALARENRSITTSDLVALYIEHVRQIQPPELLQGLRIINDTDVAVNIIDSQTNQTIGTAPAKYVEFSHAQPDSTESVKEFVLLAFHNDTGYVVQPILPEGVEIDAEAPSFVRQVLDSFQLVVSPMNTTATSTTVPELQNNATAATATNPIF